LKGKKIINKPISLKVTAQLGLVLTTAIWGVTFIMVKEALNDAPPFAFGGLRFMVAAICNLFFILLYLKDLTKQEIQGGFYCGVLLYFGYAFQNFGLTLTTASKSAFITGTNILMVPIFLYIFRSQKVETKVWLAILIATFGLYLLLNPSGSSINTGDILTFGCATFFALHILLQDKYVQTEINLLRFFFIQLASVSILSFLSHIIFESEPIIMSESLKTALIVTGVFATFIGIGLMVWAQKILNPSETAIIFSMEPVFAGLFAWWYANELLSIVGWIGGLLVVISVIWAETGSPKKNYYN